MARHNPRGSPGRNAFPLRLIRRLRKALACIIIYANIQKLGRWRFCQMTDKTTIALTQLFEESGVHS
jgi:hypothetical protein